VGRINPQNAINQWDMAHGWQLLGDALLPADRPAAIHAWQESRQLAEALLATGVNSPIPTLVAVCERLGKEAARDGDREMALQCARRAFEVSDKAGRWGKDRAPALQRFLTPQGSAAMGLIYAQLARRHENPADRQEDFQQATLWLQKSVAAWLELQDDPGFAPPHKRQMLEVEDGLVKLGTGHAPADFPPEQGARQQGRQ
jgi:hypothetical protein